MAKELMQCRHELEASRRITSEYAERTHAAEKGAEKAKERMRSSQEAHSELKERHERVLAEVQVQRNRVAQLRVAASNRRGGEAGDDHGSRSLPSSPDRDGREAHHARGSPLSFPDRPEWNKDVVLQREGKWSQRAREVRDENGCSAALVDAASSAMGMSSSGGGGGRGGLAGGGSNAHLAHLREGHAPRLLAPGDGFDAEASMASVASDKQLHSLRHQLASKEREKLAAERSADERHAQCEKLQVLVAEADTRRDEQAEAAAAAASEAAALRRQLQAVRDKVDTLQADRAAQQVTTSDALKAAERHAVCEVGVLALELRAVEELSATQYKLLHPPSRERVEGAPLATPLTRTGGGFASGTSASARRSAAATHSQAKR